MHKSAPAHREHRVHGRKKAQHMRTCCSVVHGSAARSARRHYARTAPRASRMLCLSSILDLTPCWAAGLRGPSFLSVTCSASACIQIKDNGGSVDLTSPLLDSTLYKHSDAQPVRPHRHRSLFYGSKVHSTST